MVKKEINILGYDGNTLAIIFDLLHSVGFHGRVKIILNDYVKRSEVAFQANIEHQIVDSSQISSIPNGHFVLGSPIPKTKRFLLDLYSRKWDIAENNFASFVHGSSVVSHSAAYENGFIMEPMSVISAYSRLGFGVTVSRNCSIGHHSTLGDLCALQPGVNLCGHVKIGDCVTLGPGATLFRSVEIGTGTIIGGGSVVTHNIPENVLAFGNPCKVIRELPRN